MIRKIYGVGINDADYVVNCPRCPFYRTWHSMMERCYSESYHKKQPTYIGCKVDPRWYLFSNFKKWMEIQDWQGKQLDKDFLGNGKLYGPETCCFVPAWLNSLFNDCGARRGPYPLGVSVDKRGRKQYRANLRINKKYTNLGYFDTPEEAHQVYLIEKREYVEEKMKDYPDKRVKEAVLRKVNV